MSDLFLFPALRRLIPAVRIKFAYCFLTIFCVIMSLIADAQPPDARGDRGNDGKTYGERDIERTADNTAKANSKLTQWTFDQNAIDAIVAQWKRNSPNYRSPSQQQADIARIKQQQDIDSRRQSIIREIDAEVAVKSRPFNALLDAAGFRKESYERRGFVDRMAMNAGGNSANLLEGDAKFLSQMLTARDAFTAGLQTAPPEQLIGYVLAYAPAWETAMDDLNTLLQRYPAHAPRIDTARLITLSYFYGRPFGIPQGRFRYTGVETRPAVNYGDVAFAEDIWAPLAAKYPALALRLAGTATADGRDQERNPFYILAERYNSAENKRPDLAKQYTRLALHTIYTDRSGVRSTGNGLTGFDGAHEFYKSISFAEWDEIIAAQGDNIVTILGNILPNSGIRQILLSPAEVAFNEQYRKAQRKYQKKYVGDFGEEAVLRHYAMAGDANAQNALGVYFILGKGDGSAQEGVQLLRDAAGNGSVRARFNLVFATALKLKGYGAGEAEGARQSLAIFLRSATVSEVVRARSVLASFDHDYGYDAGLQSQINPAIREALKSRMTELGLR